MIVFKRFFTLTFVAMQNKRLKSSQDSSLSHFWLRFITCDPRNNLALYIRMKCVKLFAAKLP